MNEGEHENASQEPDASLAETVSTAAAPAFSEASDASASEPHGNRAKLFAIVRAMIKWQTQAVQCLQNSTLFAERFRLLEQLGEGGFGRVYRAVDQAEGSPTLGQEMAVKLLTMPVDEVTSGLIPLPDISDDWFRDRQRRNENWIREVERHQRIGDIEGCVPVFAASAPSSTALDDVLAHLQCQPIWLSMPVYPYTLDAYVRVHGRDGKLPWFKAEAMLRSVAESMQRMHEFKRPDDRDKEVVHRDLKPSNILVNKKGTPFVTDFGLASGRYEQRFRGNPLSGTPSYLSPEQYAGHEATPRTDIFAYGVIFYWLLSGRLPFVGNAQELQDRITSEVPADDLSLDRGIPEYLVRIVMRCLAKKLEGDGGRFGSFREMINALHDGKHAGPRPPLLTPQPSRDVKKSNVGISDLRYHKQWLDFVRRPREQALLMEFINHPDIFRWWGAIGEGGVGKTRMAFELILELTNEGWDAGFLLGDEGIDSRLSWLGNHCQGWRPQRPTLIVVDYAAKRAGVLVSGLYQLSKTFRDVDPATPKVRLLLLDRPGRVYPVASELMPRESHGNERRDEIREFLFQPKREEQCEEPGKQQAKLELEKHLSMGLSEPLMREHELLRVDPFPLDLWRDTLVTLFDHVGGDPTFIPSTEDHEWWKRVDRLTGNGRPLFLQILGLCIARQPSLVTGLTGEDGLNQLLDLMLEHESNERWPDLFPTELGQTREAKRQTAAYRHVLHGAAYVTLARGIELPTHAEQLQQAAGGSPEHLDQVLPRMLRIGSDEQPSGQRLFHLPALEPDMLGERLLLRLSQSESSCASGLGLVARIQGIDPASWLRSALTINPAGTLQTLQLLAQDFPRESATVAWIDGLLDRLRTVPAGTDSMLEILAALSLPNILLSLALGNAPMSELSCCRFLRLIADNEPLWQSAYVTFISALTECASAGLAKGMFHKIALRLADVSSLENLSEESHVLVSQGAVNAVNSYGTAQDFEALERWASVLAAQSRKYPKHPEIQLRLSQGAFNAVNSYCTAQDFEALERWGSVLAAQSTKYPDHPEIQLRLSQGAFSAVNSYGTSQDFEALERWGSVLAAQSKKYPDHPEIQLLMSQCASNAVTYYGTALGVEALERWGSVLAEQSTKYPDHPEIQLEMSSGAVNAVNSYGRAQDFEALERWASVLAAQSRKYPDQSEIQLRLSQGAFNAVNSYCTAQDFEALERWGSVLAEQSTKYPDHPEIQLLLSQSAFNAVNSYGTAQDFEALERWGSVLAAQSKKYPDHSEIQLLMSQCASNAVTYYGTALDVEALERWGSVLAEQSTKYPDHPEIQLEMSSGAVNAVNSYGTAQEFEALERWASVLAAQSRKYPDQSEIQLRLSMGAFNAVTSYGTAQVFEALERWASVLVAQNTKYPDYPEIQLLLSKGAVNVVHYYGTAQEFEALEHWGSVLAAQSTKYPDQSEIQLELSKGASNAVTYYGAAQEFEALERWGSVLTELRTKYPEHPEIQLLLAQGAFNAVTYYGKAQDFEALERWGSVLAEQCTKYPEHPEIQLEMSQGAFDAVTHYGTVQDFEALERWGSVLAAQSRKFPEHLEIQLELSRGAVNAVNSYGSVKNFKAMEHWGSVLAAQSMKYPVCLEIQLLLSQSAFNAVNSYGTAQDFEALERWASVLAAQSAKYPNHPEIQLRLSQGASNAVNYYGKAQDLEALERWASELAAQSKKYPDDSEMQLRLCKGAANAVLYYGTAQDFEAIERWGSVLAAQSTKYPDHPEIQLVLSKCAFNAVVYYGTAQDFEALERWGSVLRESLPRSSVDSGTFGKIVASLVRLAQTVPSNSMASVWMSLVEYWPGFVLNMNSNAVPLIKVVACQISTEAQQQKVQQLAEKVNNWQRQCQQLAELQPHVDTNIVHALWLDRMCSPVRGDFLLPLLEALGLHTELNQAFTDPWRRSSAT